MDLAVPLFVLLSSAAPQAAEVPQKVQVAMFKKIIRYDKVFAGQAAGDIQFLVVHGDGEAGDARALASRFRGAGFASDTVSDGAVPKRFDKPLVIYLMPGAKPEAVGRISESQRLLTISARPDWTEAGQVSISIGIKESSGKPEIVFNIPRLKREGHGFPAQLLSLARVVR